jgi:hypothetical protein
MTDGQLVGLMCSASYLIGLVIGIIIGKAQK